MPSSQGIERRIAAARKLHKLAADPVSYARMLVSYNSRALLKRLGKRGTLHIAPRLRFRGREFTAHFADPAHFSAFLEVFDGLQYDCTLERQPKVILDLGSNVGFSVLFFRLKYPDAVIHAVEPDPDSFAALQRNVEGHPNIVLHNLCVSDHDGLIPFYRAPGGSISSSIMARQQTNERIDVPCVSLKSLLERIGAPRIDLLKFDIEGAEALAFRSFDGFERIGHAIGEIHPDLTENSEAELLAQFRGLTPVIRERMGVRSLAEFVRRPLERDARPS